VITRSGTYTLRALLLITAGILVSVRPVAAQTPPPPIDEIEQAQQQMKVALDEYARQAADEYL
jgi:hypothetical protein